MLIIFLLYLLLRCGIEHVIVINVAVTKATQQKIFQKTVDARLSLCYIKKAAVKDSEK